MWRALGLFLGFQLLAGLCSGVTVTQKEKFIAIQNGSKARIPCKHNDNSYITVLWYQQKATERQLQLVATSTGVNSSDMEKEFKNRYSVARPEILNTSLTINPGMVEDTAVYFCAARAGVGDLILQWPRAAIQKPGEDVTMSCYQNDTDAMWRALGVSLGFQLLAGLCNGVMVTQKEKFIAIQNGSKGSFPCEHDDSSYYTVLWCQQKKDSER
nr:uncharacterized protein LOC125633165 [Caretta caretta]